MLNFDQARRWGATVIAIAVFTTAVLSSTRTASAFSSKEVSVVGGQLHDTHSKLTNHALTTLGAFTSSSLPYPDIGQYRNLILMGGSSEGIGDIGAHKRPDNAVTWWYRNESNWLEEARAQYNAKNFSVAYRELGYVIHLLQDARVPAHQTVTFHGLNGILIFPVKYALQPPSVDMMQGPKPQGWVYSFYEDEFENWVSTSYNSGAINDTTNSSIIWQNSFTDPNSCSWHFWLSSSAANNNTGTFWGDYGQGNSPGCTDTSFNNRHDWFYQASASDKVNVAQPQLYWAKKDTEDQLIAFSSAMKPFLTNFSAPGGPLGGGLTLTLNFHVMENRTQNVTFTAKILTSGGSDTGLKAFDATSITLNSGTSLPWEKDVTLTWDGTPTSGSLSDGTYMLQAFVTDGDGNNSDNQTSASFMVGRSRFLDEEQA